MSASIYIQPVSGTRLTVGAPSSFLSLMRNTLQDDQPYELDLRDAMTLKVASRVTDQAEFKEALEQIVQAIETFGTVRFWAEY